MSIVFKTILTALSLAIVGLTVHYVAKNANATDAAVVAARLPDIAGSRLNAADARNVSVSPAPAGIDNFNEFRDHLNSARTAAEAMPGYTAILEMQEEVDDSLRPIDRIEFKTRREPFSVYMRWQDSGQEALYVDGANDNRLIVKPTKGLAALRRVWRLEPDCKMAKQNCRYPITDAGIENLVIRIQTFYSKPDILPALANCEFSESILANREVKVFEVQFNDKKSVPDYSASRFAFDKESQLLLAVDNYGWSDGGSPRLIEHYFYDQITPVSKPNDEDFAQENPAYAFEAR